MRVIAWGVVIALFQISAAQAQTYCYEPSEPACIKMKFTAWSQTDFMLCKADVERYLRSLDDWQTCLDQDVANRAKKTVNKFNCYASGNDFC